MSAKFYATQENCGYIAPERNVLNYRLHLKLYALYHADNLYAHCILWRFSTLHYPGIVNSGEDSMFHYVDNKDWSDFHDFRFIPVFFPTFDDPELERQAVEICGDVSACLFDIAVTRRLDFAFPSLIARDEEIIVRQLAVPSEFICWLYHTKTFKIIWCTVYYIIIV